jgi:hypothetical protein
VRTHFVDKFVRTDILLTSLCNTNRLATSCFLFFSLQVVPTRLTYRLFVTSCYELVVINLLTTCYVQTIPDLLEQLVTSLLPSSTLLQDDNNLFQTCQQLGTSSANTSCWQAVRFLEAKVSHLVASLPTSCQQVVFALLVPSCQQVWNKLLTTCNNLVDIIRLVARLFQQVRYSHDITILLQPCVVNLVTFLLYHDCIRLVRTTMQVW